MNGLITLELKDNLLALSRRLDWRFVFANPSLQFVVVAGQQDTELLKALIALGDGVTEWRGQVIESCDILVLHNPSPLLCHSAIKAIKPERFYIEFEGYGPRIQLRRILVMVYCVISSRFNGYDNIRIFWHWPNITNANRIISLSQKEALSFVVAKGRGDLRSWIKIAGLDFLRRTGLLALGVKSLGIAGERLV